MCVRGVCVWGGGGDGIVAYESVAFRPPSFCSKYNPITAHTHDHRSTIISTQNTPYKTPTTRWRSPTPRAGGGWRPSWRSPARRTPSPPPWPQCVYRLYVSVRLGLRTHMHVHTSIVYSFNQPVHHPSIHTHQHTQEPVGL